MVILTGKSQIQEVFDLDNCVLCESLKFDNIR